MIYLEHRYYGESQPYSDLTTEHLQFLTLDNVMEDTAAFEKWAKADLHLTGKWITIGGSYSGTLSAIFRFLHPELVVGALAASAPIMSDPGNQVEGSETASFYSSTAIADYPAVGDRQWIYQSCKEIGFWESFGTVFEEPSDALCTTLFGFTQAANKDAWNKSYYTPFLSTAPGAPSNILFTNGSDDVWAGISITPDKNSNPGITSILIQGAGHHWDLDPTQTAPEVQNARNQFLKLADGWLK